MMAYTATLTTSFTTHRGMGRGGAFFRPFPPSGAAISRVHSASCPAGAAPQMASRGSTQPLAMGSAAVIAAAPAPASSRA